MRVADWNVGRKNRHIAKGLKFIFGKKPDIVSLQEFPESKLNLLESLTSEKYQICLTVDFSADTGYGSTYLVTMVHSGYLDHETMSYFEGSRKSILQSFLYKKISKLTEHHEGMLTKVSVADTPIQVINLHLSPGVSTSDRIMQLQSALSRTDNKLPAIICGDFNISDNKLFHVLTGWARGYRKTDYKLSERREAQKLFESHSFSNIFAKKATTFNIRNIPLIQLDHVLVSSHFEVTSKYVNRRYGSDHHILLTEIALKS